MRLWIVLLAVQQAPPTLSFVHPLQCSLSTKARHGSTTITRMVATAPTLSTTEVSGTDGEESVEPKKEARVVEMYDTTLRDGTQMEGISASVNDKLKIAKELHNFGET